MPTHTEAGLFRLTAERAYEAWYLPRKPAQQAANKLALHDFAAAHIGDKSELRYLEFGVYSGASIQRFASIFTNPRARFAGFDSFLGLPERWEDMPAGHFSTDGKMPTITDPRIELVKGWFQNTVPEFFGRRTEKTGEVTLVHFDADLYSSTLFLLSALWWHIPEYFFIMDEFFGQELAAMHNFVAAYPVDVEFYSWVDNRNGRPEQIFGRLRATRMIVGGLV